MENKIFKKVLISFVAAAVIFCAAGFTVSAQEETQPASTESTTASTEPTTAFSEEIKNGFFTENDSTYYYIDGVIQTGFADINSNRYYFDKSGKMKTGFVNINGSKYYFNKEGKMKTGIVKISGSSYYFDKEGKMKKGFIKISTSTYYFNKDGKMKTGFGTINKAVYYFDKNGKMKTGLNKINGKYYYFNKKGVRQYGYKKIGKYNYYFKKDGAAKTGFHTRTFKKEKINTYYDNKGHLKKGDFKVGTVNYKATKKIGKIYSCRNIVPVICQRPELPTGCEIVSWTMMANYAGVKISKTKAADIMPRSSNPYYGFVGSPYRSSGGALIILPEGLKNMTKKYLGSYKILTNASLDKIKAKLFNKHLVLVWVTGLDGFGSHTVALTGYDRNYFYYNDPWTGTARSMKYSSFMSMWRGNGKRALSY